MQALDELGRWVEHSIDISFGVDIILNFFTAYFPPEKDGHLEYDMKKVGKQAKGESWLDVPSFP